MRIAVLNATVEVSGLLTKVTESGLRVEPFQPEVGEVELEEGWCACVLTRATHPFAIVLGHGEGTVGDYGVGIDLVAVGAVMMKSSRASSPYRRGHAGVALTVAQFMQGVLTPRIAPRVHRCQSSDDVRTFVWYPGDELVRAIGGRWEERWLRDDLALEEMGALDADPDWRRAPCVQCGAVHVPGTNTLCGL